LRHPSRYGFPPNLIALAVFESDPSQMRLTRTRVGELFPLAFEDCEMVAGPLATRQVFELPLDLIVPPRATTAWTDRIDAFHKSLAFNFAAEEARSLSDGLGAFLSGLRASTSSRAPQGLGSRLMAAASQIASAAGGAHA
jgi:hypothetical protein